MRKAAHVLKKLYPNGLPVRELPEDYDELVLPYLANYDFSKVKLHTIDVASTMGLMIHQLETLLAVYGFSTAEELLVALNEFRSAEIERGIKKILKFICLIPRVKFIYIDR